MEFKFGLVLSEEKERSCGTADQIVDTTPFA